MLEECGPDIIIPAGGGILGHPLGYTAGARAWRQAFDAAMAGIPLDEASQDKPELRAALEVNGARRLAVTGSVSPRWRELVEELKKSVEVEVVPARELVEVPEEYEAKRFTPFWKKFGREWGG